MKKRIKQIKDRIDKISIELVHQGYLEGVVIESYKKEIEILLKELEELEKKK